MSLKLEIETWVTALAAYDAQEFGNALKCFEQIADTSKILFNCGVIHATLGEHTEAVACYQRAVQLDQYLAIAYFQQGVSNFLMGDFEEALANFNDTLLYLRGNNNIDYDQLGLKFKLYSCEVLFNRGLCYIYLQQKEPGMQDLMFASKEKAVPAHEVIDEAIREEAEGYTVFSIPVGVVYRPNEAKVKNLKAKNYLGQARLVASQEWQQSAESQRRAALSAHAAVDDRPDEKLSYAALNLVRPDLRSRTRQQSEPPLHRNVFPPTPPPELERSDSTGARRNSASENGFPERSTLQQARPAAKPLRLELGAAAFDQRSSAAEKPRQGPKRSESERPIHRREYSGPPGSHSTSARYSDGRRRNAPLPPQPPPPQSTSASSQHRSSHHRGSEHLSYSIPDTRIEDDPIEAYSPQTLMNHSNLSPLNTATSSYSLPHRSRSSAFKSPVLAIAEVNEDVDEYYRNPPPPQDSPLAFELVSPNSAYNNSSSSGKQRPSSRHRRPSASSLSSSTTTTTRHLPAPPAPQQPPPPPEMRKVRLKVHAEDMRYVMTTPYTPFADVEAQIRAKLALRPEQACKLKIRDEDGDLVTVGDDDDWLMAVGITRAQAAKERAEMGKLEVWVQEM